MRPSVFISHSSSDANIAEVLQTFLEKLFLGIDVFVSSRDLKGGDAWLKTLYKRLEAASAIVAIVTPASRHNLWVHFEAGAGFIGEKTIPLCVSLSIADLATPLSLLHARAADVDGLRRLADDIADHLHQRRPTEYPTLDETLNAIGEAAATPAKPPHQSSPSLDHDPELAQSLNELDQRVRNTIIDAVLRHADHEGAPSHSDLESMHNTELAAVADTYDLFVPPNMAYKLQSAHEHLALARDPSWKKAVSRRYIAECHEELETFQVKKRC